MTATLSVETSDRKCINLATFTNGRIKGKHADDLNIGLLSRTDTHNLRLKEQKIMVAETQPLIYVGKNYGEVMANTGKGLCKYYVGVFNPVTGKMQVCDTEMFSMQPQITVAQDEVDVGQGDISRMEKDDMLTDAFGSSRKRRAMESRHRQAVAGNVLKGVLNTAIDDGIKQAKIQKQMQGDKPPDEESVIPPRNVDAKRVEDVYLLKDILNNDDMEAITNLAKVFVDSTTDSVKEWRQKNEYPIYVLSKLGMLSHEPERRLKKSKYLLYLSYLMHLYRMNYRDLRRKEPLPSNWPLSVKTELLNSFTITVFTKTTYRCIPSRQKDKLLNYILTLCLILDEFTVDVAELYKDLRIGQAKLATHFRILGAAIQKKTVDKVKQEFAVLKVPFKVADESYRVKGKRSK